MTINSKAKGKAFERRVARIYREAFGTTHRGDQSWHGSDAADVECEALSGLWIECKTRKEIALYQWWKQATDAATDDRVPVLHIKQNGGQPLVVMSEDFYFNLLGESYGRNETDQDGGDASLGGERETPPLGRRGAGPG